MWATAQEQFASGQVTQARATLQKLWTSRRVVCESSGAFTQNKAVCAAVTSAGSDEYVQRLQELVAQLTTLKRRVLNAQTPADRKLAHTTDVHVLVYNLASALFRVGCIRAAYHELLRLTLGHLPCRAVCADTADTAAAPSLPTTRVLTPALQLRLQIELALRQFREAKETLQSLRALSTSEHDEDDASAQLSLWIHVASMRLQLMECAEPDDAVLKSLRKESKTTLQLVQRSDRLRRQVHHMRVALCLKARIEFLKGNHEKAVKLLCSVSSQDDERRSRKSAVAALLQKEASVAVLNNLACIQRAQGRHGMAALLLAKALRQDMQHCVGGSDEDLNDLPAMSSIEEVLPPPSLWHGMLLRNVGVDLLQRSEPERAAQCFARALHSGFGLLDPVMWLLLGACCVQRHVAQVKAAQRRAPNGVVRAVRTLASGAQVVMLPTAAWTSLPHDDGDADTQLDVDELEERELQEEFATLDDDHHSSSGSPSSAVTADLVPTELSLSNGAVFLRNAVSLARRQQSAASLLAHAHLMLAYTLLSLGASRAALQHARAVAFDESQQEPKKELRFLARLYCSEAYCMLSSLEQAQRALDIDADDLPPPQQPISTFSREAWYQAQVPRLAVVPQAALYINLSTVMLLKGDLAYARKYATSAARLCPGLPPALRQLVYMSLAEGRTRDALHVLRTLRAPPPMPMRY